MYNSIILFSCLFGSVYLNVKSIEQINMLLLQGKSVPNRLIILNSLCFTFSGLNFYIISHMLLNK
jgi:hypothetical protein